MKHKKLLVFALALSASVFLRGGHAFAASKTWTGGGSDTNMQTAANWGGSAPNAGDDLSFPDNATAKVVVNDYGPGTSFRTISFGGTGGTGDYIITGAAIMLTEGLDVAGPNYPTLNIPIALTASDTSDFAIDVADGSTLYFADSSTLYLGSSTKTFDIQSHHVIITNIGSSIETNAAIAGSGSITQVGNTSSSLLLASTNSTYTGSTNLGNGDIYVNTPGGFGASSGVTVGSDVGSLLLAYDGAADATLNNTISLSTPIVSVWNTLITGLGRGGGGCSPTHSVTLTGSVTLGSDVVVHGCGTLGITGDLSGSHTITAAEGEAATVVINSSNNTSSTSNGTITPAVHTTTYADNAPSTSVYVDKNNIAIVTGIYGDVYILGGILKGTGTVGAVTMDSGVIAPGMSPGVLNTGALALTGGAYQAELGGTTAGQFDQLNVTGAVDLGAATTLSVSRYNNFKPKAGDSFVIIKNDGADAVTGTFKDLVEGATFKLDGYVLKISYKGGDGNDVVVSVVSVPTTPDTGFVLLQNNPTAVLTGTTAAALGIAYLSRRYGKVSFRR